MSSLSCPCGRSFYDANALRQHRRDTGHNDLPNRRPDEPGVEDWHAVGIALTTIAARVKAGEDIDPREEAEKIGISSRRLVRALRAHGAVIPEFA